MAKNRKGQQPTVQGRPGSGSGTLPAPTKAAQHAAPRRRPGVMSHDEQRSNLNNFPVGGLGQSTNEELESSREELQSLNEVLTMVDSQLREALAREDKTSVDLHNILNSSAVATLFLDRDLNIRFFTPAAAPMFNLMSTDVGRPFGRLANRFSGVDLLVDAQMVLATLKPIRRDVRIEWGNWYRCSISPYRGRNDWIDGVIINLADISDLKASKEELQGARGYAEAIINTIRAPLIVLDEQLEVVSASQSFYSYFRCTPGDTLGRTLPDTDAHHLDTAEIRALLDRLRSGEHNIAGQQITVDVDLLGKRTLLLTAAELQDSSIGNKQILISFDDISDFKRAEQQLAAAKRAAELANLSKSRFLAAASHDLRQPLQTFKLLQGALRQQIKDEEALTLLDKADRAVETMAGMLATLLDINQLETGVIRPILVDFPVNEIFMGLKAELADQALRKGLSFRVVPCGLSVRSDWRLLEQMVRNLVSNAFRYTDQGKILLGARRRGSTLTIEVWDTGLGISKDQIPRIFEDYYQVDDRGQRGGLGLGLGLAIVQRLGELLGHAVSVRSEVGKGSVFSIRIAHAHATPALIPRKEEPARRRDSSLLGNILVIEDEVPIRELLELTFNKEGHRVISAASGEAALALVEGSGVRPDLLITDYNLVGGMSGVRAAAVLRAALSSQVPAIVLTGDVRKSTLDEIAEYGYVGIQKPMKLAALSAAVQQLLDASQPALQASTAGTPAQVLAGAETAPTIFVVDDDRETRDAMQILLSQAGYGVKTFAAARTFLDSYRPGDKDCLVTDVRMPGMGGFEMLAQLATTGRLLPTIVLTGQGDIAMAVDAMRAGAVDFIEKPSDPETLLSCIERALRQSASSGERTAWRAAAAMRVAGLTARERQVLDLVVAGHPNKVIAARLDISQRTVESHRAAVMEKMDASSISDLVRLEMAARAGDAQL
jgi:two-component system CheB/CheR fusion protein